MVVGLMYIGAVVLGVVFGITCMIPLWMMHSNRNQALVKICENK